MLDDIGRPKPRDLARALGVSQRTVSRWIAADSAPTPVLQALFWLTRWGQSSVNADAHNAATMHAAMVGALRREIDVLRASLERLGRIADFGAANDPAPDVPTHANTPASESQPAATPPCGLQPGNRQDHEAMHQARHPL